MSSLTFCLHLHSLQPYVIRRGTGHGSTLTGFPKHYPHYELRIRLTWHTYTRSNNTLHPLVLTPSACKVHPSLVPRPFLVGPWNEGRYTLVLYSSHFHLVYSPPLQALTWRRTFKKTCVICTALQPQKSMLAKKINETGKAQGALCVAAC